MEEALKIFMSNQDNIDHVLGLVAMLILAALLAYAVKRNTQGGQ